MLNEVLIVSWTDFYKFSYFLKFELHLHTSKSFNNSRMKKKSILMAMITTGHLQHNQPLNAV